MFHNLPQYHTLRLVVIALALAMLFGASAWAQFFDDVDAMDGRWLIANAPISSSSPTDSMGAATVLVGERRWGPGINNHYNQTFTSARIAISTSLSASSFEGGVIPVGTFAPSLDPNSAISIEVKTSSSAPPPLLTFTPGFDSSRTVSPLVIPVGGAMQTVTLKVKARDSRYFASLNNPPSGIQMGIAGNVQSFSGPSNLTPGVENLYGDPSFWGLNNPQPDKEYTFTVGLRVDNQTGSPIVSKPDVRVLMIVFPPLNLTRGTSVTIPDAFLGGDIVYSLDQEVNWNSGAPDNYQVGYPGLSEPAPSDTTPPTIICPPDIIAYQDSAYGAVVQFNPTATDDFPGVTVTCTPPSGSVFPPGKTAVRCTATDASGNFANCSFQVTEVPPPTASGTFVIGDLNAVVGSQVTFWGAQWSRLNSLSGGAAPSSFKGFAESVGTNLPSCGGVWTSDPGNSSGPPDSIPSYIAVIVSSSMTKSGSTIAGNTQQVVIVRTNPGYDSNPGHAGTGTVVAVICP